MKPYGMSVWKSRMFLAIDEWLGIIWLTYLWRVQDPLFWKVLPAFIVAIYLIGYPFHFYREYLAEKDRKSILDLPSTP